MNKDAKIEFNIKLNENNFPVEIKWDATDAEKDSNKSAEAILISIWDSKEKSTLSIDLWTDKMLINDMEYHYFQTFMKMADTFESSSRNKEVADMIRKFANDFGERLKIL
ncbi:MAG: gliding motility protein GldC [Ignavibacteria bacterium]|jgi:gliding motility-associated protein GldC